MKIFITGIAGFLGSKLAERLLKEGHDVFGNDNMVGGDPANVPRGAVYSTIDCLDLDKMSIAMKGIDLVYHLACCPHEGFSNVSPFMVQQSTSLASTSVFTASIKNNVQKIVYASSMSRYGDQMERISAMTGEPLMMNFSEKMIPAPVDPYAIAKVCAEQTLKNLSETYGFEYTVAVPHNIYGPNQNYSDPYRNVAAIFAHKALKRENPVIYGDGTQMRCFSYIDDCTQPLSVMGKASWTNAQTYNIGPDDEFITINDLAEKIYKQCGVPFDPIYVPSRPREVKHANCSADKARKDLGYESKTKLDVGLDALIEYIERSGIRSFRYDKVIEIQTDITPKTWTDKLI